MVEFKIPPWMGWRLIVSRWSASETNRGITSHYYTVIRFVLSFRKCICRALVFFIFDYCCAGMLLHM